MEIRKIYVIYNANKFKKEDIVKDIKEEGYKHHFFFCDHSGYANREYLDLADEVWVWGKCDDIPDFILAQALGADIWFMG